MAADAGETRARPADRAAYARDKHRLIGELRGTVLEIGAGSGANFGHLDPGVDWVGLEPHARSRRRISARREVIEGHAEDIPLADDSVDGAFATVVLCSVTDPDRALAEVRRVLRPGGRFVFFEHVAAGRGTWTRRGQALLEPFSRRFDHGCRPTRETGRILERAGFAQLVLRHYRLGRLPYVGGYGVVGDVSG